MASRSASTPDRRDELQIGQRLPDETLRGSTVCPKWRSCCPDVASASKSADVPFLIPVQFEGPVRCCRVERSLSRSSTALVAYARLMHRAPVLSGRGQGAETRKDSVGRPRPMLLSTSCFAALPAVCRACWPVIMRASQEVVVLHARAPPYLGSRSDVVGCPLFPLRFVAPLEKHSASFEQRHVTGKLDSDLTAPAVQRSPVRVAGMPSRFARS